MYSFHFNNVKKTYELAEMVRMFLPGSDYFIFEERPTDEEIKIAEEVGSRVIKLPDYIESKDEGKRYLYDTLKELTGKTLDWGILTGVRPVKFTGDLIEQCKSEDEAVKILRDFYYLSDEKIELLLSTRKTQDPYLKEIPPGSVSVYIGIPFCPSRCIYCSFPSYKADYFQIEKYLEALSAEIRYVGNELSKRNIRPETIYVGGGTPTVLEGRELERLLLMIEENFDLSEIKEFTLEAGRPDTISELKVEILRKHGVDRISINPQSMKGATLETIGRNHSPEEIVRAFKIVRSGGFDTINADLIAGLPGENMEDFLKSIDSLIELSPENITIHTLAIKRASRLKEIDEYYSFRQGKRVDEMVRLGGRVLRQRGYRPYYLYRQKQMAGNLENVGYSLPGKENIYNIRIMEENQTVLALGAGGITKVWYPESNRLERVPNVSNYEIYIERIDEMINRKREGIFNN